MDFDHPLLRSLLMPLCLAFLATAAIRGAFGASAGPRWASAGLALALLAGALAVVGWQARPGSLVEKLPWVVAAAGLLGLALEALKASLPAQWAAASALWALALAVLGTGGLAAGAASWLVGAAVIAAVLRERADNADAAALLAVAGLGLALVAMLAGSALLFELALGGAAAVAGMALWLWPWTRIGFGPSGRIAAVLSWLALAHGTARLTQAPAGALLLLAAAFAAGVLAAAWPRRTVSAWASALLRALVAALVVAGAVALTLAGGGTGSPASPQEDPYYTPRW